MIKLNKTLETVHIKPIQEILYIKNRKSVIFNKFIIYTYISFSFLFFNFIL